MKKIILTCVIASFVLSSCGKDSDPCVTSMASVAGTYKLTSLRYKPAGGVESEIIGSFPTCRRDDLHVLNANGIYNYQDAGAVCTPNSSFPGDWTLNGNVFTLEGETYTLQSFDCTTLVAFTTNFPNPGDKATSTFVRQ